MKREEILRRLNGIFCDVFMDDTIVINDSSTADDIDDWDSLTHITLVLAAEKKFGLRLRAAEVGRLANVGEFVDILVERATL